MIDHSWNFDARFSSETRSMEFLHGQVFRWLKIFIVFSWLKIVVYGIRQSCPGISEKLALRYRDQCCSWATVNCFYLLSVPMEATKADSVTVLSLIKLLWSFVMANQWQPEKDRIIRSSFVTISFITISESRQQIYFKPTKT